MNTEKHSLMGMERPFAGRRGEAELLPSVRKYVTAAELLHIIRRRKWLVITIIAVPVALSAIFLASVTPRYTSSASVVIEDRQLNIVDIKSVLSGLARDDEALQTELDILKSPSLAEAVIASVGLGNHEEFRPATEDTGLLRRLLSTWTADDGATAEMIRARKDEKLIRRFSKALDIEARDKSRVVHISFTAENPALSAETTNTVAKTYIRNQQEAKLGATQVASAWLNERISKLRSEVQAAEKAVAEFRAESGLTGPISSTNAAQQVEELNEKLIAANADQASAEARLNQATSLLRSPQGISSAAEVLNSPLIQNLRKEETLLAARESQFATQLGPAHPHLVQTKAELTKVQGRIRDEMEKIVRALTGEVQIAQERSAALAKNLKTVQGQLGDLNTAEVKLRALESEANASRNLFETFLQRFKETSDQKGLDQADARILTLAKVPTVPSFPRKKLIIALVAVAAGIVAVAIAVFLEQTDRGLRTPYQIEELVGARSIGLVPALPRTGLRSMRPQDYLMTQPISQYGEAIRGLYTELHLSESGTGTKLVLVTSSVPSEGKTALVASVARFASRLGRRVLVVDCDFRQPRVHQAFNRSNDVGISDFVSMEKVAIREIVFRDSESAVDFIPAGQASVDPTAILDSERFKDMLTALRKTYDVILIDSPPVLAVTDAKLLASVVDRVVVVAKWGTTTVDAAAETVRQLLDAGAVSVGVALCQVDLRRYSQYGLYYGQSPKYLYGR